MAAMKCETNIVLDIAQATTRETTHTRPNTPLQPTAEKRDG